MEQLVDDRITVTEFSETLPVTDALREIYREQGYEHGYSRATRDLSGLLVVVLEEFVRSRELSPAHQALLRDFHRYLDRHVVGQTPAFTYVEHGLGI